LNNKSSFENATETDEIIELLLEDNIK